jgi:AraC-like DNA-binding protein
MSFPKPAPPAWWLTSSRRGSAAREHAPVLTGSAAFRRGFVVHLAHRLHGEFRQRDEVSRLVIESIALGMLAEASRRVARAAAGPTPAWLQQARSLIERHFAEPLPLTIVAGRVGVHPVHLARTFRRVYRTTFGGYVRQLRIEFARADGGSATLSDIAAAAGFATRVTAIVQTVHRPHVRNTASPQDAFRPSCCVRSRRGHANPHTGQSVRHVSDTSPTRV